LRGAKVADLDLAFLNPPDIHDGPNRLDEISAKKRELIYRLSLVNGAQERRYDRPCIRPQGL
jgi:hypothetical protein